MIEYITHTKFKDSKDEFYILYGYPSDDGVTRSLVDNFPTFLQSGKDYMIGHIRSAARDLTLDSTYVVRYSLDIKEVDFKKLGVIFMLMKMKKFSEENEILDCTDKSLHHIVDTVIPKLYNEVDYEVNKDTVFSIKLIGNSSLVDINKSLELFENHFNKIDNKVKVYAL